MEEEEDRYDPAKGIGVALVLAVFCFWLPLIVLVRYWSDISIQQFALDVWRDLR